MVSGSDAILLRLDELLEQARGDQPLLVRIRDRVDAVLSPTREIEDVESATWHGLIGGCPALLEVRKVAQKFANANVPILVRGESGTGKDVLAKILHEIGPRAGRPFVSENCAAIPQNLLESVLFGHKLGAFTGAIRDHAGHFVTADTGTLFLDEIGDMPLAMQAKLLRVVQEGEVRPVGGTSIRKVDVRIIAATNQDLEQMVAAGTFREDLYYRLNVLQLALPPLRERGDDILLLARSFLQSAAGSAIREFDASAEAALARASWPGNVRQLQNEIQRAVVLANGPRITAADFSAEIS
jgi:transcriptional regulator with GAF, ATPase, and Fis domain